MVGFTKEHSFSLTALSWPMILAVLIIVPPLDDASAGSGPDGGSLAMRVNRLLETRVENPEELQRRFFEVRRSLPSASGPRVFSGGVVVFDPAGFSGFTNRLVSSTLDGVTVYSVTVSEEPDKRDTLFYNELKELIAVLPRLPTADPFDWLMEWESDWVGADVRVDDEPDGGSSASITFALLSVENVTVLARNRQLGRKNFNWMKRGGLGADRPSKFFPDLSAIRKSVGEEAFSSGESGDSDGDGLCDWDEAQVYMTDMLKPDTDGDGLTDGEEVFGWKAWDVSWRTNRMQWVEEGSLAKRIVKWSGRIGEADPVSKALSDPVRASVGMGRETDVEMRVSTDGYVYLGGGEPAAPLSYGVNLPLPSPGLHRLVAVFWDELILSATPGAGVTVGNGGDDAVVTWTGARLERKPEEGLDFQMEYSASDGAYTFRYRACAGLKFPFSAFCTVGIQATQTVGLARVVFNRAGIIKPGMTIRFAPAASSPLIPDTDGDGFKDGEEAARGWNPARVEDRLSDWDGDGLTFGEEMKAGTDPQAVDTDGDGFTDAEELAAGLNPLEAADAKSDFDRDGLSNEEEWCYGTDLWKMDSDGDGTGDAEEILKGSDPVDSSDRGIKPDETMLIQIRLAEAEPASNSLLFQLGRIRCRGGLFKGNRKWASFLLPLGRTYRLETIPREGFVESPRLETEIRVNAVNPGGEEDSDMWICPPACIQNPRHVFGFWSR